MSETIRPEERFVDFLEDLLARDDRAALAALRRGLGKEPGAAIEMHPFVMPRLYGVKGRHREDVYFTVAALFGLYPRESWQGTDKRATNLGASLGLLNANTEGDSVERRFVAMLNARVEDLPSHLRQIVGLLKANGVPVDWKTLLTDMIFWNDDNQRVQRRWSRAFWQAREQGDANDSSAVIGASDEQTKIAQAT